MSTVSLRSRARRRHRPDSVSDLAFRVKYLRRSRELYRRFLESKPWITELYTKFLGIHPGMKIVDVGCGPGDFTRLLARLSKGRAKVLGIDSNQKSIDAAIADTEKAGLSRNVSFRLGDVNKIPVNDKYADLTSCRTLLMHLTEPLKAVKEMARITRAGGTVLAVEGGKLTTFHDPNDEAFSDLAERAQKAWIMGVRKLEGKEYRIGDKLPGIFQKAGLADVRVEVQSDAWVYTDPRRKLKDIKDELRFDYSIFKERRRRDRKYLLAGGMSGSGITSYFDRLESKTRKLMSDDELLKNDPSFYAASFYLVAGTKKKR